MNADERDGGLWNPRVSLNWSRLGSSSLEERKVASPIEVGHRTGGSGEGAPESLRVWCRSSEPRGRSF